MRGASPPKATRGLNLSEDVFTGMDAVLRGQTVVHREYFQAGKGALSLAAEAGEEGRRFPVRWARGATWASSRS